MRLVAYVRVSSDTQTEDGNGLDVQERMIRTWANKHRHELVALHTDAGLSGSLPAEQRPGLASALDAVRLGEADGLVVRDLDRLARSVTVQEAVLAELWKRPDVIICSVVGFVSTNGVVQRDDPDDPLRTAMREMAGVFAGLERRMLVKRMRDGRKAAAARGTRPVGAPPYGWAAVGGELVPIPAEQEALRLMRRMRKRGESTRAIAAALAADPERYPTKRGGKWTSPAVSGILARPKPATRARAA